MTFLSAADAALWGLVDGKAQGPFLGLLMPFIRELKNLGFILVAVGIWILPKERKAGWVFLVFVGLNVAISNQLPGNLLKNFIGRVRPCHVLENVRMLRASNSSFSFPSSHTMNISAAA